MEYNAVKDKTYGYPRSGVSIIFMKIIFKRLLFVLFCIGCFHFHSFAENTYSLQVKTSEGRSIELSFSQKPVLKFERDSVVIYTEDMVLVFNYGSFVLSFVETFPESVSSIRCNEASFSFRQRMIEGYSIPLSCSIRFYSIEGKLLGECKPDSNGNVKYSIERFQDRILIVNVDKIGLRFKILIP